MARVIEFAYNRGGSRLGPPQYLMLYRAGL